MWFTLRLDKHKQATCSGKYIYDENFSRFLIKFLFTAHMKRIENCVC